MKLLYVSSNRFSSPISFYWVIPALFVTSFLIENKKRDPYQVQGSTIRYIGNMGVLISSSSRSVLIDGLHEYYGPDYLNLPDLELKKIIERSPPYTGLATSLFTHYHRDHYSPKMAKKFLQISSKNRVAGSPQVIDSLPTVQTIDSWNKNSLIYKDSSDALSIYSFNIPHTGKQRHANVQNVAYLVKSGTLNILHIGDADTDTSAFGLLDLGRIDVMIVPVWFLMDKEGVQIIRKIVKPLRVIATHISPNEKQALDKYKIPGIETDFFTKINQVVLISK